MLVGQPGIDRFLHQLAHRTVGLISDFPQSDELRGGEEDLKRFHHGLLIMGVHFGD